MRCDELAKRRRGGALSRGGRRGGAGASRTVNCSAASGRRQLLLLQPVAADVQPAVQYEQRQKDSEEDDGHGDPQVAPLLSDCNRDVTSRCGCTGRKQEHGEH